MFSHSAIQRNRVSDPLRSVIRSALFLMIELDSLVATMR
jgi:hypothetical protein